MHIESPAPVRKPIPLVPLVDVVFLLLMYFMLSSTFTKFGDMEVARKESAADSAPAAPGVPGVIIRISQGPAITINGDAVGLDRIETVLDDYFYKGVRNGIALLQPAAEVQDLVSVLERVRHSRLSTVSVTR